MDLTGKIAQANGRLKSANIKVRIVQRGDRISLVATLPPKPGTAKNHPHQQRLSPGIDATPLGLKQAEAKAKEISALLNQKRFTWDDYLHEKTESKTVADWAEILEKQYFSERGDTPAARTTWKNDYLQVIGKLPMEQPITIDTLEKLIFTTEPNSRSRRRYALACAILADCAGLTHNLRKLVGKYSTSSLNPRNLPSDKLIAEQFEQIKDPCWQWVYGVMACYGLRNHEVFVIDLEDYPIAFVHRGKTGERYVWALYPEWAEQCGLSVLKVPAVTGRNNGDLGNRVTKAFQRSGVPFSPYNLRHAWAVRSLEFGLDISLASAQMGHSVAVHSKIYHHWITKDVHQRAMNLILNNPNRPMPPSLN